MLKTRVGLRIGLTVCLLGAWCVGGHSVLAVTVTNTNDSGSGSLRAAIASGADEIDFSDLFHASPQTIFLESSLPFIQSDLTLLGPGADMLTIDGQFRENQNPLIGIFSPSGAVSLEGFTLTGGYDPISTGNVGGIFMRGDVRLSNVELAENRGTAIFNQGGELTIEASTIAENEAEGIFNQVGTTTIINSTIAWNGAQGVFNQAGDVSFRNSTIALNGKGLHGAFVVESSILSGSTADLWRESTITNSLVRDRAGPKGNGNIFGADPKLGPLGYNGGTTRTMVPQFGSAAIDAGSNSLGLLFDQRGFERVLGGQIDMGAVETVPEPDGFPVLSLVLLVAAGRCRQRPHTH